MRLGVAVHAQRPLGDARVLERQLEELAGVERRACVVGDNLAVVRYGAERGRLHNATMHRPLASALASADRFFFP